MPHIELDGVKIETKPGKTIIEAAYDNGMQIPHFCWHPELSVAGNCRMCLCEVGHPSRDREGNLETDEEGNTKINYIPKLQIACATPVSEGMIVKSKNERSIEAQEAVMEFLLINHPLDCPICDEAGECKLQEYAFKHSKGQSRFDEEKNHKPKRQVWGPNVVFDAERCISCSRCIRFADEIANQPVLTFVQRGDHVTIELFDGTVFDSPYSMNVIELCPVGALTSPHFRFKARVWEMSFNDSISYADGSGSNIRLGVRNNEILRVEPRANIHVNKYWLTDDARLNYIDFVNNNRITEPQYRVEGVTIEKPWNEIIEICSNKLSNYRPEQIGFIGSARATNEDNYVLKKFAKEVIKTNYITFCKHIDESYSDDFLGVADRAPNTVGIETIGLSSDKGDLNISNLVEKLKSGEIRVLYVMEEDFKDYPEILENLDNLSLLIIHAHNDNHVLYEKADIILPASTYAEIEGTYTNLQGRVQHFTPALVTKENMRFMGMKMSRWDKFGADNDRWTQHEQRNCKQSWRILSLLAKQFGFEWSYKSSKDVFADISETIELFKNMDYRKLDEHQGLLLGKADTPENIKTNYVSHVMKPQYKQKLFSYKTN